MTELWHPRQIEPIVRRFVRADPAVVEDLAMDIWFLCWTRGWLPSTTLVRNICTDWLRHRAIELLHGADAQRIRATKPHVPTEDVHELLDRAGLSPAEQTAIWEVFWNESRRSDFEPALTSALDKLYTTSRRMR